MRVGSLFSGIGGLDLGLERAGMEIVWQVEYNEFCQKVLKKHWPEVPCYGDIKEIDFTTLPPVDLICGGFPCQPVSCAGKRQGDKDERWLWPEFYRAICEARPRWVLVENVPGLLSASDGRLFGGILGDLAILGYDTEWGMLSACSIGAPHVRKRVFIVAYANSFRQSSKAELSPKQYPVIYNQVPDRESVQDWWSNSEPNRTGAPEPELRGMANGIPNRVDRLRCLGNAVVPQVVEWIGRRIVEVILEQAPLKVGPGEKAGAGTGI